MALQRQPVLTNKLLLQLDQLRLSFQKTWEEVSALFSIVCDQDILRYTSLRNEINRANRGIAEVNAQNSDVKAFLDTDVGKELEIRNVGPFLQKLGLKRHHLLASSCLQELPPSHSVPVTNGTIIDLMIFQKDEGMPLQREWLDFIGLEISGLSDKQLRDRLKKTRKPYDSIAKHLSRPNCRQRLQDYLFQSPSCFDLKRKEQEAASKSPARPEVSPSHSNSLQPFSPSPVHRPVQPTIPTSTPPFSASSAIHATACGNEQSSQQLKVSLAGYGRQLAGLRRELESLRTELSTSKEEAKTLRGIAQERAVDLERLQPEVSSLEKEKNVTSHRLRTLQEDLVSAKATISSIRHANFYRRLKRKENDLKRRESAIQNHEKGTCEKKLAALRRKLKSSQTTVSNLKRKLEVQKQRSEVERQHHDQLLAATGELLNHDETVRVLKTTVEGPKRQFTSAIVKTVISLISCGISGKNCAKIIQIVAKHLFDVNIADEDLPSERTSLRFADQGHYLAKYQVAETILRPDNRFDLHIDGTTRDHQKYVGQQVTTATESLCCGFEEVAAEDAKTLVDVTIGLLQECVEMYDDENKDQHFMTALRNLSGLMSDRASVNKAMKRDINDLRKATLGTEEDLEFLFCNAHFLLGLGKLLRKFKTYHLFWGVFFSSLVTHMNIYMFIT